VQGADTGPLSSRNLLSVRTMSIPVDNGVPLPPALPGRGESQYPWADLEVGDSFFAVGKTVYQLSASLGRQRQIRGHTYTSRTVVENGKKGVRVWRIT
jgi:hypothetical protein